LLNEGKKSMVRKNLRSEAPLVKECEGGTGLLGAHKGSGAPGKKKKQKKKKKKKKPTS